jgi:hypothetical protein
LPFSSRFLASSFTCSWALSTPAPPVTQTVSREWCCMFVWRRENSPKVLRRHVRNCPDIYHTSIAKAKSASQMGARGVSKLLRKTLARAIISRSINLPSACPVNDVVCLQCYAWAIQTHTACQHWQAVFDVPRTM